MENLIDENTLYYFFSTIAQVIAALTALLAIFIQFKIVELKDFLVGDGNSVLNRTGSDPSYSLNLKFTLRLRDSIDRKDLSGIKEVIELLSNNEKDAGHTLKNRPRGLQFLYNRFCGITNQIEDLRGLTKKTILISIFTILISLISIAFVDLISKSLCVEIISLVINGVFLIVSLYYSYKGILLGIENRK
ncbi:MAG: hypothetical protein KQH67_05155 [Bacteroidetes bacterium]|nr:hypothetical protein [Bacteroidota bacterium]